MINYDDYAGATPPEPYETQRTACATVVFETEDDEDTVKANILKAGFDYVSMAKDEYCYCPYIEWEDRMFENDIWAEEQARTYLYNKFPYQHEIEHIDTV